MKKVFILLILLFVVFGAYHTTPESSSNELSSLHRVYAPLRLPALPKNGLNKFSNSADAYKFQESLHERTVFGWSPGYPVYLPAFDSQNRPYLRQHDRSQTTDLKNGFQRYNAGRWESLELDVDSLVRIFPDSSKDDLARSNRQDLLWDPKMAVFDKDDTLYTPVRIKAGPQGVKSYVLMYSRDHGRSWTSVQLLGSRELPEWYDLERPYSSQPLPSSPAFIYYQATGKAPGYENGFAYWQGTVGRLTLQTTRVDEHNNVVAEPPVVLSETAQPIGYRSGGAVKILRSGDKYFVTWLEATMDHKVSLNQRGRPINTAPDTHGNPYSGIWIAEYDIKTRSLKKTEILKTWPLNDSHNQPGIVRSKNGTLHVIGGAHGAHFVYTRSLKPDSIDSWSPPEYVNLTDSGYAAIFNIPGVPGGSQTYVSLVIDPQDRMHLAFRLWTHDKSVFDHEYFGALAYQSADPDQSGQRWKWSSPKILVYPNAPEYSHYYQLLTLDRQGQVYLEYSQMRPYAPYYFKSPDGFKINTSPMLNSALLRSSDRGDTWHLVNDSDFTK